jgi:uncharacterized protein
METIVNRLVLEKMIQLKNLCIKHKVKELFVFGSATNGNFSENSDIDFLVSFHEMAPEEYADKYFDLHDELEELFGREIDLVTVNSLSNPYLIQSINENKELIYAA